MEDLSIGYIIIGVCFLLLFICNMIVWYCIHLLQQNKILEGDMETLGDGLELYIILKEKNGI